MKRIFLVMLIVLWGHAMVVANPLAREPGVVSYSINYSVYFNNEANAIRWMEAQRDFTSGRESSPIERRAMATMMETMFPGWSQMVRIHSDFLVMVVRSPVPGESTLSLYVRGSLARFWQF